MTTFTLIDRDELAFQIGFYTQMAVRGCIRDREHVDFILSKIYTICTPRATGHVYQSMEYVLQLDIEEDGVKVNTLSAINGKKDKDTMMAVTLDIDHALNIFNRLWVK